jgi:predicted  nucleic acid-binding Zn-ribbon protein
MSRRFRCTRCGTWFEPDPEDTSSECSDCQDGLTPESEDPLQGLPDVGDIEDHYRDGGTR